MSVNPVGGLKFVGGIERFEPSPNWLENILNRFFFHLGST
jgi:hypothetical protein